MRKVLLGGIGALTLTLSLASCLNNASSLNLDNLAKKLKKEGFTVIVADEKNSDVAMTEEGFNAMLEAAGEDERVEIKTLFGAAKLSDTINIIEFADANDCNALYDVSIKTSAGWLDGFAKTDGAYFVIVSNENLFDLVF